MYESYEGVHFISQKRDSSNLDLKHFAEKAQHQLLWVTNALTLNVDGHE